MGVVGRDSNGAILCAKGKIISGSFSPLMAKLFAIQIGIYRAIHIGWKNIIMEFDALNAIQAIKMVNPFSMEDQLVRAICRLSSEVKSISILYIPRSSNHLTHELARHSFCSRSNFVYSNEIPSYLKSFELKDLRVV